MQNQNNNNTMISRQSSSRSGTPNSMVVLEQGRDSPTRPPSGRRSVNRRSPLKRGGSSLEILAAEEDDSSRTPSRLSNTGANTDSPRQTLSAGSVSRLSFTEDELGNGDGKGGGAGLKRSSSIDRRVEVITPDSPRKQVYLTTVKRNFEQHGMPKNEELAKAVQNLPSLQNGEISNSPSSTHKTHDSSHRKQHGERSDRLETDAENNDLKQPGDCEKGLERLTLEEAGGQGSDVKGHDDEMNNTDSYYISHGSTSNSSKASASASSSAENDSYYLTHDRASSSSTSETAQTATDKTEEPTTQTDQVPGGTVTSDAKEEADDENESDDDDDDDDEEEDNEEDEEGKAPFQLLGEFLEAVMEEDYENAEKLCKMVLLYEPDNAEAKQFQPLIEEMLKREREAQLWGSESDGEGDDADDDDDDDDDSDDSDDDDDSDDEDSDKDEGDEESSSEEEEDEANEDKSDTHVEK